MNDKTSNLMLRLGVGAILSVALLYMFVINPGPAQNHDKFSPDNLWEAVHPWNIWLDTIGLIGLIGFALFLTGYLGKAIRIFKGVSVGTVRVIGVVCMLAVLMFFL